MSSTETIDPRIFADEQLAAIALRPAPSFADLDVAAIRAAIGERAAGRPPGPAVHEVADLEVGGVGGRLFRPSADPVPLVVYLHGGGWTVGDVASYDRVCRRLAAASGTAVLAVEYRLAPEHPWPASVDDAVAVLRAVADGPDVLGPLSGAVAVAGDSAGGTLAALACLRLRDEHPAAMPALQVLIYANCDLTGERWTPPVGGALDATSERFFVSQWVPDEERRADPRVSPLRAPDLSGLPAAVVVTAEHDTLRVEAEAYAARLQGAGVPVRVRCEAGLIHNFLQLDEQSPACAAAGDRLAADVAELLGAR